jgi:hypothetical protein
MVLPKIFLLSIGGNMLKTLQIIDCIDFPADIKESFYNVMQDREQCNNSFITWGMTEFYAYKKDGDIKEYLLDRGADEFNVSQFLEANGIREDILILCWW